GVHDFVGNHDAADALREAREPLRPSAEPGLLARLKLRADFDNAVVEGMLREERGGERAAAGAELEDRGAELLELPDERAAEKRAELGRGHEIALAPELLRAARVVAHARLVERELHVAGERNPAVIRGDLFFQAP